MSTAAQRILVIGGNGFIGSAICKAALARGMQVTSVSSSGRPYQTAKGHAPAWTSKVDWQTGDALHPETFAHLFSGVGGVVHTLGTLIEGGEYKQAIRDGNVLGLAGSFLRTIAPGIGGGGNPLKRQPIDEERGSYEAMNRDAALRVCEAFLSSMPLPPVGASDESITPRAFVHISAEDVFRPLISSKYIEMKRQAEEGIDAMVEGRTDVRAVHVRPSLVYHAHHRPLTTPPAVLLDMSATLHSKIPSHVPSPSGILRAVGSTLTPKPAYQTPTSEVSTSVLESVANALTIPPIHVDHVADAVCMALNPESELRGPLGVWQIRELLGWHTRSSPNLSVNARGVQATQH
ncbi:hypothetical protein AX16_004784 [Volvariella volvacea WC 439]|nr:hypothetical protein AX16_004784 [Volvariella volvacea WC 439]